MGYIFFENKEEVADCDGYVQEEGAEVVDLASFAYQNIIWHGEQFPRSIYN